MWEEVLAFLQPWRKKFIQPKPEPGAEVKAGNEAPLQELAKEVKVDSVLRRLSKKPKGASKGAGLKIGAFPPRGVTNEGGGGLWLTVVHQPPNIFDLGLNAKLPDPTQVFVFHNQHRHIVLAHLVRGTAFDYQVRDGVARRQLKPALYPLLGEPFHRTHIIPFGYHGSEKDEWLVVGWCPDMNMGVMKDYENEAKRLSMRVPVYWGCCVERTSVGAKLSYVVHSAANGKLLLEPLELELNARFKWVAKI